MAVVFVALVAGVALAPLWLGGARPIAWGASGLFFAALVLAFETLLVARGQHHPFALARIAAPALLFSATVVWIGVQMSTRVPPALAHPAWAMAALELGRPLEASISVNRGATALALVRLLTDASVFWLALQLCRAPARALVFLKAFTLIVAAYAALGLALAAFASARIPLPDAPDSSGFVRATFVNRNHFATFAGLGLATGFALLLRQWRRAGAGAPAPGAWRAVQALEATARRGWVVLGCCLVTLAALLGTASRGGVLAAGLGLLAVLVLSARGHRRRPRQQVEIILAAALLLAIAFIAFGDPALERLAASGMTDANRGAVYAIVVRAICDAPLTGFGYGAFADIFPLYRDASISPVGVWDKAHNVYLEVWAGLGLPAGTALMGAVALAAIQCAAGALRRHRDATPAIVGVAASLVVGLHALVDFSVQIQGVSVAFMALLGAGVAGSESSRQPVAD